MKLLQSIFIVIWSTKRASFRFRPFAQIAKHLPRFFQNDTNGEPGLSRKNLSWPRQLPLFVLAILLMSAVQVVPQSLSAISSAVSTQDVQPTIAAPESPGDTLVIERIEIQGNSKTRAQVIRRYLRMQEGAVITPELIAQDHDALSATNFFKRVEFSAQPGSAPGKVVMVIEVEERHWPWLEVAGGFSELEGWYLIPAGVRFDNFFGGGGMGGGRFILADRTVGFYWHYREQELFGANLNFQLKLGSFDQSFIHYLNNEKAIQKVNNDNLTLAFSGAHGWPHYVSAGLNFNTWNPETEVRLAANDSTITNLPPPLTPGANQKSNSVFARLQLDTRNSAIFPRHGAWGALQFEKTLPGLRSDNDFSRVLFDARWYAALGKNVLALHAKAGHVSETAPFYERFYLGGAYSVRGYAERSLTPLGWGTEMALGQVEMRFPVTGTPQNPGLSAALFFDAGHINDFRNTATGKELFMSVGYGFRLKLPIIGLLRCDFAYPFYRDDFRFHIALGHTF